MEFYWISSASTSPFLQINWLVMEKDLIVMRLIMLFYFLKLELLKTAAKPVDSSQIKIQHYLRFEMFI